MLLDQYSLLAAIGFSGAALCVTLLLSWVTTRTDSFLLTWAFALVLIVIGVILFGLLDRSYHPAVQCGSFAFLILGFVLVHAGCLQFRWNKAFWTHQVWLGLVAILPMAIAFAAGLSGPATILANVAIAGLLMMCGMHSWLGRHEAPLPMAVNAVLYCATAVSFLFCCIPIMIEGQMILTARPANWAEDLNSIMAIIGITGIGAISLALNQTRVARRHHNAAMTDPLTGLLNRRALFDQLGRRLVQPGTAILVIDLDHFKSINDRFGHACGDVVLERFADLLREHTAACDLVARIGGEEFCIVMPHTSPRLAKRLAEHIRLTLHARPICTLAGDVSVTASIGVAICSGSPEPFEAILERSDRACYEAKNDGRNRVQISSMLVVAA
ncbi:GGDEF domain-containing protein [Tianweitania sp. BSSL-BM11]|uniref:diguanylate cyclase n=1 Tax=Tianweitania aestuarii TaxID=2814886 RepID=A0ABS5S1F4_9HYPH|nr:GGDEF domain-containing protein [Tianweitania aestuarii]MBS9722372.1 GGDEF domain-containing protein [Tianweitania aestuarii]